MQSHRLAQGAGLGQHLQRSIAVARAVAVEQGARKPVADARQLAHLLRLGLLPTGYIYPKQERALRDLLRRRLLLVRQRSLHHVSLQSLIARHSGQRLSTHQIKTLMPEQLQFIMAPGAATPCAM